MTEEKLNEIRSIMYRDDCCDRMVPSDVRELVGEIDRCRTKIKRLFGRTIEGMAAKRSGAGF